MRRSPALLLALCAFATLSTDRVVPVRVTDGLPPVSPKSATKPPTASGGVAAVPLVSESEPGALPAPVVPVRVTGPASDEAAVSTLLARLSTRHTGMSDAERLEVVRTILREAARHELEPELVVAVIEVESAGYHLAVSHVGALGLMQLLPSTGEEVAGKLGIEWLGDDTLFDPAINVKLGTAYLRELTDRFDSVDAALAAYNWGPGRIRRRLRDGMALPSIYVEKVQRAYARGEQLAARRS